MINNESFNNWLDKLVKISIPYTDKTDEDIIIRRYAEYRVKKNNNINLSKLGIERLKTVINTCFLYCYRNQNLWYLIIEGIIDWPSICGNDISIQSNNNYFILKIGNASVFICENENECKENYNNFLSFKETY